MEESRRAEHELIKSLLKHRILNNPMLTDEQKRSSLQRLDEAAREADLIEEILRLLGCMI